MYRYHNSNNGELSGWNCTILTFKKGIYLILLLGLFELFFNTLPHQKKEEEDEEKTQQKTQRVMVHVFDDRLRK